MLVVALVLAWMAFQWGLGNDIVLPSLAARAFDAFEDRETWSAAVLAVAAASATGFVFWGSVQVFDALLMLGGLRLLPAMTERISAFLRRKDLVTPYAEMRWTTRWIIAYATGVSLLCLVDVLATGRPGIRRRRSMITVSVLLSAGTVAAVVALVTTAATVAARIPATASAAEVFIRFAKNPLTWVTIFLSVYLLSRLWSRVARRVAPTMPEGVPSRLLDEAEDGGPPAVVGAVDDRVGDG